MNEKQKQNKEQPIFYVWPGDVVLALRQDLQDLGRPGVRAFLAFWNFRQIVPPPQEQTESVQEKEEKEIPEINKKSLDELAAENPEIAKIQGWIREEMRPTMKWIESIQEIARDAFHNTTQIAKCVEEIEEKLIVKDWIIPTQRAREAMEEKGIDISTKDVLMTVKEAAEYCGVHKNTIYRWCAKGLRASRYGGRFWKIKKSDLDQWLEVKKIRKQIAPERHLMSAVAAARKANVETKIIFKWCDNGLKSEPGPDGQLLIRENVLDLWLEERKKNDRI